jgi:hypothetical protein
MGIGASELKGVADSRAAGKPVGREIQTTKSSHKSC